MTPTQTFVNKPVMSLTPLDVSAFVLTVIMSWTHADATYFYLLIAVYLLVSILFHKKWTPTT